MKIVVLDTELVNPGDLAWDDFSRLGELVLYPGTPPEKAAARLAGADVALLNRVSMTRDTLRECPSLRYIGLFSTGYNQVDIAAARQQGITVSNVPGYSTVSVSQHTIALLLAATNHVASLTGQVQSGAWVHSEQTFPQDTPSELYGKTLGIIGLGNIGKAVAGIAAALGMRVLATGTRPTPEGEALATFCTLPELLAASDVVSLHCPLLPATRHIIDEAALACMKPGAILLNTSRGPLIDDAAVAQALHSGHLAAAGLDVLPKEPPAPGSPLLSAPRCFITPHMGWRTPETRARLLGQVLRNLLAFLEGNPENVVSLG